MKGLFSTLAVAFLLLASNGCDSADVSSAAGRLTIEDAVFFGNKVDVNGDHVIVGTRDGNAYVFERTSGGWERQARLDNWGGSSIAPVALNGSYAFIGDPGGTNSQGALHIFSEQDGEWMSQESFYAERELGSRLGVALSTSHNLLAVSSNSLEAEGGIYILEPTEKGWSESARLTVENAYRRRATSVAAGRSRVVVSVNKKEAGNVDTSAAYIFKRQENHWDKEAVMNASDATPNSGFGQSLAYAEGHLAVGAPSKARGEEGYVGAVYVFEQEAGSWQQRAKLIPDDTDRRDHFGSVMDLSPSGDYLISQSIFKDEGRGAAYVFHRQPGGQWQQQAKLTAPTRQKSAFFGEDVAITDRYAVVGAPGENGERGAAYVFERNGTNWTLAQ